MGDYEIKCVVKDREGDIEKIGYYEPKDSKVYIISRKRAIENIKNGKHTYYINNKQRARVNVYANDFLRSTADSTTLNNLDNLRECVLK